MSSSPAAPQQEIDESLYSRQLYVLGHEAQRRMAQSNVLVAGLNGLGVEIAKNVILAGVRSVTLFDTLSAHWDDLGAQFYLSEADIGANRAAVSARKLAELNPYVHVTANTAAEDVLSAITGSAEPLRVVVLVDQSLDTQERVCAHCHAHNIAVILADVRGVFGQVFCDFGEQFLVHDTDGEPAASSMLAGITRDRRALVTVLEETRHALSTGDVVRLTDIAGMHELNGREFTVEVKDPFSFEIDCDTRAFSPYERSGYVNQVKQPVTLAFRPFAEAWDAPGEFVCDFVKIARAPLLHLAFRALHVFRSRREDNAFPRPGHVGDAQAFVEIVRALNDELRAQQKPCALPAEDLSAESGNEEYLRRFAMCARGVISPMCALLGGVAGQEVLKACSGKFSPIKQWFYCDAAETLSSSPLSEEEVAPLNSRYDAQIMVFGRTMQQRLSSLRMFLVGAGAIGCEMLKNWAMMGIATTHNTEGNGGVVYVTDMDRIEKSNLSRQFLFRNADINHAKSSTAVRAVQRTMNPHLHAIAYEHKVAPETETLFNDDFYESLDMVCTALDNVEARLYLDQKCLFYAKPMLESGTLGAKGHTQIVAPGRTENYGATRDPPEKSIPTCTLKHFPHQIEHTLQWAREWFEEVFKQSVEDMAQYLANTQDFLTQLATQPNVRVETLRRLRASLLTERPQSLEDCVRHARRLFEELYAHRVQQLLHNFPLDRVTASGTPFWSGAKKPPAAIVFDAHDALHAEFVLSVARVRAFVYGLTPSLPIGAAGDVWESEREKWLAVAADTPVEPFRPAEGVKIATTEEEAKAAETALSSSADMDVMCTGLAEELSTGLSALANEERERLRAVRAIDFDKDIDAHMRVVAAASNLRARNYRIPEADLHTSRGIAGKITPAIATATALVTGTICLEIFKLLQDKPLEQLANTFTNLAVPLFTSMEPEPPKTVTAIVKGKEWKWTPWDRIDINRPGMTVRELVQYLEDEYALELSMLSSGVTILFSDFMDRKKKTERQDMNLRQLVETVTKKPVPSSQKFLVFEIIVNDPETGDEVEVPYVRFRL